MPTPLAHALPQSIGAVALTLVLTALLLPVLLKLNRCDPVSQGR